MDRGYFLEEMAKKISHREGQSRTQEVIEKSRQPKKASILVMQPGCRMPPVTS